jgi:bifunctional non-homologous end joining protein LigD
VHEVDVAALVRTKEAKSWLLIKHKDRFVTSDDVTAQDRSVLTGVSVEDMKVMPAHRIPASQLVPAGDVAGIPGKLEPMHAKIGAAPFNAPDWMWEPKLDGYRVLAFIGENDVSLRSRRGLELAPSFPRLTEEPRKQGVGGMVLDGEIVALDAAGKPSFNALANRVQVKAAGAGCGGMGARRPARAGA